MFNDVFITPTALSSFNNAALYSPFFMAVGLLTLPVLFILYLYGDDFIAKLGWKNHSIDDYVAFFSSMFLSFWLMLFGGNYAVIRDDVSVLPLSIAFVLCFLMIIVAQKSVRLGYVKNFRKMFVPLVILLAVFSAPSNLVGILLQVSAILCGLMIGWTVRKNIPLIPLNSLILLMMVVLVFMQPEFFRFGQLGNLTPIHEFAVVFAGFCAITSVVTKYVHARDRIHDSAYIKLKWLCRIMSLLAFVLFLMTESVPVFIGLICAFGVMGALSVYHMKRISGGFSQSAFALLLISVGIIIICPVLSAIGTIYLAADGNKITAKDFMELL